MSSTTAGAKFGFSLIGLILLTNLVKYPFLLVGTRFTAVTGLSLLEGFQKRNKFYLPIYLIVGLITGTFTISAVSFVTGLLLKNIVIFSSFPPLDLAIGILIADSQKRYATAPLSPSPRHASFFSHEFFRPPSL